MLTLVIFHGGVITNIFVTNDGFQGMFNDIAVDWCYENGVQFNKVELQEHGYLQAQSPGDSIHLMTAQVI